MSLPHFYLDDQVIADEGAAAFPLRLSAADARHFRALRVAAGERVAVVDAAQDYFVCEVVDAAESLPLVRIAERGEKPAAGPTVVVAQGLAKGDKVDAVVRQGTEIGVSAFLPMACERSVVRLDEKKAAARVERWRAVARGAAMQAGRRAVPEVAPLSTVAEACAALANATAVLVCWEEAPETARLADAIACGRAACGCSDPADARVAVVVGPEGGLSQREVEAFLACSDRASLVSLGPTILRTETAGVVAAALALYELGGLGNAARAGGEGVPFR